MNIMGIIIAAAVVGIVGIFVGLFLGVAGIAPNSAGLPLGVVRAVLSLGGEVQGHCLRNGGKQLVQLRKITLKHGHVLPSLRRRARGRSG